jgi:hypothetical protein
METQVRSLTVHSPEGFLEEIVMKQKGAEEWVRKHTSMKYFSAWGKHRWNCPEIWMVTGVQYVTGGTVHTGANESSEFSAAAGADIGAAVGGPPNIGKVKVEGGFDHSNTVNTDYQHKDERIWAAQFMPIEFDFGHPIDEDLTAKDKEGQKRPATVKSWKLDEVPDFGGRGIRASQEVDDRPRATPPKMFASIARRQTDPLPSSADEATEDPEGLVIDDRPYIDSLKQIKREDVDVYNKSWQFLTESEKRRAALKLKQDTQAGAQV